MIRKMTYAIGLFACTFALSAAALAVAPLGPGFSYQAQLKLGGSPLNDTADFEFTLWDDPDAGAMLGSAVSVSNVNVVDGLLTAEVNAGDEFGPSAFNGEERWLEIAVRSPAGTGAFTTLAPRQPLTATPFAHFAQTAQSAINNWALGGNTGTNPASHFIGTTDDQPLVLKANGQRALQMEYVENDFYLGNNLVGGFSLNSISSGVVGGTVFGGARQDTQDFFNRVTAHGGTVSGGLGNQAGQGDGIRNGPFATVGGGFNNTASGRSATVAGGVTNTASGSLATVGGGSVNTASELEATVGGGTRNTASREFATVGGAENTASGVFSTVGGGFRNTASGDESTVAGGRLNTASGRFSLAAGFRAKANHEGAFVWADNTNADFASTGANQFLVRASGGVGINGPSNPAVALTAWASGTDFAFFGEGTCGGRGPWVNASDARFKTNVAPINDALDSLLNLRGVHFDWDRETFKKKGYPEGRQVGFIAQEVQRLLPSLVHTTPDGYLGVAYAGVVPVLVEGIKQQQKQMDALKEENDATKQDNAALKAEVSDIKARLAAIEAALP